MPYNPPATDWTTAANAQITKWNNQPATNYLYGSSAPTQKPLLQTPSDMAQFRQSFGNGYASEADYKNWSNDQQRTKTLSDFVNQMSSANPAVDANVSRTQSDATKYGKNVDDYLAADSPTMATGNRFESGLSDAETRLRALLDNPDSIKQSAAYKFRVGQGEEALQRSMGANGLLNSGNRLMELTRYGQDMGSQEYDAQAGRLSGLVANYGQGYVGDKNANTSAYGAQSNAWNQRGGMLRDLYGGASTAANQSIAAQGNDRVGFANAWTNQAPKPYTQFPVQYAGQGSTRIG